LSASCFPNTTRWHSPIPRKNRFLTRSTNGLVHPFNDGNGRLARLFLNAKLAVVSCGQLIVSTSLRVDYLVCLDAATVRGNSEPFVGLISLLIRFSVAPPPRKCFCRCPRSPCGSLAQV
jgi:hypothetical protein